MHIYATCNRVERIDCRHRRPWTPCHRMAAMCRALNFAVQHGVSVIAGCKLRTFRAAEDTDDSYFSFTDFDDKGAWQPTARNMVYETLKNLCKIEPSKILDHNCLHTIYTFLSVCMRHSFPFILLCPQHVFRSAFPSSFMRLKTVHQNESEDQYCEYIISFEGAQATYSESSKIPWPKQYNILVCVCLRF